MIYQTTFKRYEIKYLMTRRDEEQILLAMQPYMKPDQYGHSTIRNIYYDTDNYRLIRHSLEKPAYKEKLRVRSYQTVGADDPVFVELKKKYESVVYKRRLTLPEAQVMASFDAGVPLPIHSQIGDEIEYFRNYYQGLHPVVFLSYDRDAYCPLDGSDFRITFDENILYREMDFSLRKGAYGKALLEDDQVLMEIKSSGSIPLWLSSVLTHEHLFRTSYSKYGSAYQDKMLQQAQGGVLHARQFIWRNL